jgi:hypothetical protein
MCFCALLICRAAYVIVCFVPCVLFPVVPCPLTPFCIVCASLCALSLIPHFILFPCFILYANKSQCLFCCVYAVGLLIVCFASFLCRRARRVSGWYIRAWWHMENTSIILYGAIAFVVALSIGACIQLYICRRRAAEAAAREQERLDAVRETQILADSHTWMQPTTNEHDHQTLLSDNPAGDYR